MQKPKVVLENVYKEYSLLKSNKDKLKDFFFRNKESKSFFAVKNINFEVYSGETIGIIGINGSGKSTLSNLLGQVIPPTTGNIEIDGETSLIAISVGLNGQLSGLENIELKCMMHGMSTKETEKVMPKIIEFADIGAFIDQPVKNYSSGMKSRLGFAISVHTNPDVLVVDEALSVGDQTFYDKCMKKIREFKDDGKTIFFISHSASQMRTISDRVMWIHYGEMKEFGEKNQVLNNYQAFITWFNALTEKEKKAYKDEMFQKQMKDEMMSLRRVKKKISNEEKRNYRSFQIQVAILAVFFAIMTFFIITDASFSSITKQISAGLTKEIEEKAAEKESIITKVERDGFVQVDEMIVYENEQFKESVMSIPLFSKVYVVEQFDDQVYKVEIDGKTGFANTSDISTDIEPSTEKDLPIETLLPYLSDGFNEAYHYYLSFFGQSISSAEDKIFGLEKKTLENGQTILERNDAQLKYFIKDDVIEYIELSIEQALAIDLEESIKQNAFRNKEGQKYYVEAKDYIYIIDMVNSKLSIKQR